MPRSLRRSMWRQGQSERCSRAPNGPFWPSIRKSRLRRLEIDMTPQSPISNKDTIMRCYDDGALRAYLDDTLPIAERDSVAAHVSVCAACRGLLEEQRALTAQVAA